MKWLFSPRSLLPLLAVTSLTGCPDDPVPGTDESSGTEGSTGDGTTASTLPPPDGSGTDEGSSTTAVDPDTTTGGEESTGTTTGVLPCAPLALPPQMIGEVELGSQAIYRSSDIDLGGADSDSFVLAFFTNDTGAHDLGVGANASIDTCEQCVLVQVDIDPMAGPQQVYFADMGSVDIDASTPPLDDVGLMVTFAGVRLAQVDAESFEPIPGGGCLEIEAAMVEGVTSIEGWSCPVGYYGTGDGCDCGCGIIDPDCPDATAASCEYCLEGAGSCVPTGIECADAVVPDNNGVCDLANAWDCDPALYDAGDGQCDCGCGAPDPDCATGLVNACDSCGEVGSCSEGALDCGEIEPGTNYVCSPIPGWRCNPGYYGAADGCDCGCGIPDPDCAALDVGVCDYCGNYGSCAPVGAMCPSVIDAVDNAVCDPGMEWTCDPMLYGAGDGVCNCGCGVYDPDCEGLQGGLCDACDDVGSCGEGGGGDCTMTISADFNYRCAPPPAWTCNPDYYGAADGCDCGCGVPDPDCPDAMGSSCDYCEAGSCSAPDCSDIDPGDNSTCV